MTQTVVKARYARGAARFGRSRAAIKYQVHRPDTARPVGEAKEGKTVGGREERMGFDLRGELNRSQMLDRADHEGRYHYRLVLSPHPELGQAMSEEDFQRYTRTLMSGLEDHDSDPWDPRREDWTAVIHMDQEHPHVHVMFYTGRLLDQKDFSELRTTGGELAQSLAVPWVEVQPDTIKLEAQPSRGGAAPESDGDDSEESPAKAKRKLGKDLEPSP